jgi:hypothetical protein
VVVGPAPGVGVDGSVGCNSQLDDILWEKRRWNGSQAYAETKFQDVLLAFAVARLFPGVKSNSLEPGRVPTKMGGAGAPDGHRESAPNPGLVGDERRTSSDGFWEVYLSPEATGFGYNGDGAAGAASRPVSEGLRCRSNRPVDYAPRAFKMKAPAPNRTGQIDSVNERECPRGISPKLDSRKMPASGMDTSMLERPSSRSRSSTRR